MRKVIIDNKKLLKLFIEKEKLVNEAKKMEEDYEKVLKEYEEHSKKLINKMGKLDTVARPLVEKELSKITLGEYEDFKTSYLEDGEIVFNIMNPETAKEEYIEKFKAYKAEKEKKEKDNSK